MDFGRINSQPPATQTPATTETQQTTTAETATGDSRTLEQQQATPQPATQSHRQSRTSEARFGEMLTRSALENQLERSASSTSLSKHLTKSDDKIETFRNRFLANTQEGALTCGREGEIDQGYVPNRGRGRGANSGVTIGVGVEVRHLEDRQAFANEINASPELRAWIASVPGDLVGEAAHDWVRNHPSPTLTPAQVRATYEREAPERSLMAERRLTGSNAAVAEVRANDDVKLQPEEYAGLDPRIREFLTDLAWNPRALASGNQNDVARALRTGLDLQNVNDATRTYEQFRQLRSFMENLSESAQPSDEGRMMRIGWIDARMQELLPQVDPQYLSRINGGT